MLVGARAGVAKGGPLPWAPKKLSPTFDLDPNNAGALTLSSGLITQARDAAGGALVLTNPGTAPLLDGANKANGRAGVLLTHAGNERLRTVSGGLTGNAPHSIAMVCQVTSSAYTTASGIIGFGQENSGNSTIGPYWGVTTWFGGGNGILQPQAGTADLALHVVEKTHDGTTTVLRIDGSVVGTAANTYSLVAGLGLISWATGALGDARIYRAVWLSRCLEYGVSAQALADRRQLERYLATTYGLGLATRPRIQAVGDSLTAAYESSDPTTKSYPARLAAHGLGASTDVTNWGVVGRQLGPAATSSTMLNAAPTQEDYAMSGCRPLEIVSLLGGHNDIVAGRSAADIWADVQTYSAGRRARGAKVAIGTVFAGFDIDSRGLDSTRQSLNTLIRAGWSSCADALIDYAADARLSNYNDATYFNASDKSHLTDAGYDVMAQIAAPTLIGLGA